MRTLPTLGLVAAFLAPTAPTAAADTPADGFSLTPLPVKPPVLPDPFGLGFDVYGLAATLSGGDVVTFDGERIERFRADGTHVATLGTLPAPAFPGAFAVAPGEGFAIVGESSNGDVFRVDLAGAGMTLLANVFFNFDAVFEDDGHVLISANTTGSFVDNDILRLDATTGAITPIASVGGPSGPVALDALGNLYYGLLGAGSVDVILWTHAQLDAGVLLSEADALVVGSGFRGASSLAFDPVGGALYLAENDFVSGLSRIVRVGPSAATSTEILAGAPFETISNLEFTPGDGQALFLRFQPARGGTLRYSATDFFSFTDRLEVRPARSQLALSGPGLSGPGPFDFSLSGAVGGGFVQVLFGPASLFAPIESTYVFPGIPPLHTGLDLATMGLVPVLLPVDAAGDVVVPFQNPGGLEGWLATQALLFDGSLGVTATSTSALL